MAIIVLQQSESFANTIAVTGVTAGSALHVVINGSAVTAVSDNVNGSWTAHQVNSGGTVIEYIFIGSAAGAFTITVTGSATNINFREMGGFSGTPVVLGKSINDQTLTPSTTSDTVNSNNATNTYQECLATGFCWSQFQSLALSPGKGWRASSFTWSNNALTLTLKILTSNIEVAATWFPGASTTYTSSITLWGSQGPRAAWL